MTKHEKYAIYCEVRNSFLAEDAESYIRDYQKTHDISYTEKDVENIVCTYLDRHDCDIANSSQWQAIVENYFGDRYVS